MTLYVALKASTVVEERLQPSNAATFLGPPWVLTGSRLRDKRLVERERQAPVLKSLRDAEESGARTDGEPLQKIDRASTYHYTQKTSRAAPLSKTM